MGKCYCLIATRLSNLVERTHPRPRHSFFTIIFLVKFNARRTMAATLPDDILLEIILRTDLPTLKSLSLVSHAFYNLINAYASAIKSSLFKSSGIQRYESAFGLARHGKSVVKDVLDVARRVKLARWTAAVRLECEQRHTPPKDSDPDTWEWPWAVHFPLETMCEMVVIGLGILWRLSEVAKTIVLEEVGDHGTVLQYLECLGMSSKSFFPLQFRVCLSNWV